LIWREKEKRVEFLDLQSHLVSHPVLNDYMVSKVRLSARSPVVAH